MEIIEKGVRLTGDARGRVAQQVIRRYGDGTSIRDIAAETGRSYGFVHRLLVESGVTLRSRGGAGRRREG